MDKGKIQLALDQLVKIGYIKRSSYASYKFTDLGNAYTIKKSDHSWIKIKSSYGSLWVRSNPKRKNSWGFIDMNEVTEEQFNDFCEYYGIKIEEPMKLVICDEVEFMDI